MGQAPLALRRAGVPASLVTESVPAVPPRKRLTTRLRAAAGAAVADQGRTVVQAARDHALSWPVVAAAFTSHARAVLPAQPEPVQLLGIDEIRRGRPRWIPDEVTGVWQTAVDRWHVGFVSVTGALGLLAGQVEGHTAQAVIDWLADRDHRSIGHPTLITTMHPSRVLATTSVRRRLSMRTNPQPHHVAELLDPLDQHARQVRQ